MNVAPPFFSRLRQNMNVLNHPSYGMSGKHGTPQCQNLHCDINKNSPQQHGQCTATCLFVLYNISWSSCSPRLLMLQNNWALVESISLTAKSSSCSFCLVEFG
jgi:hypothetical protein